MKIAYIVLKDLPFGGGIEKYTEEVGSRLVKRGHDVIVYTMRLNGTRNDSYRGMRIKIVPTLKSKNLEKLIASFMASLYQCMEKNIDIVHYHAFGPAMFSIIPRLLGRKVVVQGHGLEWKRSRWGIGGRIFLRLTEIPSVRFPHIVTVVSEYQKKHLIENYSIDSVYIPTGINPPQKEKPELIKEYGLHGNDYIFFATRLVKEKGAHYLIDAYNRLKTDIKLVIAGDAQYENEYKSELYLKGENNKNIIFTGFITGKLLKEFFSNCYLFVLPSEIEGLSTVLLEAMSYGNCCITSDIPENQEALDGHGFYFKNKDIDDLAKLLEVLIKDRRKVEIFKKSAYEHVMKKYSWNDIAIKIEKLYYNLLQ